MQKLLIYVAHSTHFDYQNELYLPIQQINKPNLSFILPHILSNKVNHSKEIIAKVDFLLAEVSYPSTGMGIEMGWADGLKKPIYCLYKTGTHYSSSLPTVTNYIKAYQDHDDLVKQIISICVNFK